MFEFSLIKYQEIICKESKTRQLLNSKQKYKYIYFFHFKFFETAFEFLLEAHSIAKHELTMVSS